VFNETAEQSLEKTRESQTSFIKWLFISSPISTNCEPKHVLKSLVSVTTQLHAWLSTPSSFLAVALRPISPHCQAYVNRKRETKAEIEGGPTYLNTMLLPHYNGARGFVWRSASAARTSTQVTLWSDWRGLCRLHVAAAFERHGAVTVGHCLMKLWQCPSKSLNCLEGTLLDFIYFFIFLRPFRSDAVRSCFNLSKKNQPVTCRNKRLEGK